MVPFSSNLGSDSEERKLEFTAGAKGATWRDKSTKTKKIKKSCMCVDETVTANAVCQKGLL